MRLSRGANILTPEMSIKNTQQPPARLVYIDWLRGLACVLMFQAHCYDSWFKPELRQTRLYRWSQELGTLPAPLFIFVSGISFVLLLERLRSKELSRDRIAQRTMFRGLQIFGLGLLFRVQEFVLGFPKSPWTDLLRVDILNILGLGIMLMGAATWLLGDPSSRAFRKRGIVVGIVTAGIVAMLTPPLWTTHRPKWLPWPLETYVNGVHTFQEPQAWLFPLFPWVSFAFVGLSIGFLLQMDIARRREAAVFAGIGGAGVTACLLALAFDAAPIKMYAVYDYWHTSPNFLLLRCGSLMIILSLTYAWCRYGLAQTGFSPIIQLGKTSLLVYWAHMEFVYGRLSILRKNKSSLTQANLGMMVIFLAMIGLSIWRTRYKRDRRAKVEVSGLDGAPA
jgi:uncharacterized membrane protein